MNDPYAVLGVGKDAADEDVKKAYRDAVAKYSTDEYANEPMASAAQARINELNSAYDRIIAERRIGNPGGSVREEQPVRQTARSTSSYSGAAYAQPNTQRGYDYDVYAETRALLQRGDVGTAEQKLMSVDSARRGAEWNFLMGSVSESKGYLDVAYRYFSAAHSSDPNNTEYAAAYDRMTRQRANGSSYNPYAGGGASGMPGACGAGDDCSQLCQCLCMYSMCQSCCCGGR
ncbi:MAG: DnaJ domain-containing protein [Oscillospiraceae bacterium]|nr:DnaJ domain-containing protein [Oscillospiraceae bacterium]